MDNVASESLKTLNDIKSELKKSRHEPERLRDFLEALEPRKKSEEMPKPCSFSTPGKSNFTYNGKDLLKLVGADNAKIAIKVCDHPFTESEVIDGMVSPQKRGRESLSPKRVNLLKETINVV